MFFFLIQSGILSSIINIFTTILVIVNVTLIFNLDECFYVCPSTLYLYWIYLRVLYFIEYGTSLIIHLFFFSLQYLNSRYYISRSLVIDNADFLLDRKKKMTVHTDRIFYVNIKSEVDRHSFCFFNLIQLFGDKFGKGVLPPMINTKHALIRWCMRNHVPIILGPGKVNVPMFRFGSMQRNLAVRLDGPHVTLVRYSVIRSFHCPTVHKFYNCFLFGYRQMEARVGKLAVSAFRGMKRENNRSFEFLGDDLAVCLPYAGSVSMSELMSKAESIFDPVSDCLYNIINHHGFESVRGDFNSISLTGDLQGFLMKWKIPQSWAVGFIDGNRLHVMSERRRIKNVVIVNGKHVMTVHIPITLSKNTTTYYCDTKFVGARGGKKWIAKAPGPAPVVYPGAAGIRQDIARNRDWLELQDTNKKIANLNAPPKKPSTDPHELTGRVKYAESQFVESRIRVVCTIFFLYIVQICFTPELITPWIIVASFLAFGSWFEIMRKAFFRFSKYGVYYCLFINSQIYLGIPRVVISYLQREIYDSPNFTRSSLDVKYLLHPKFDGDIAFMTRYMPVWELMWFVFFGVIIFYVCWKARYHLHTVKLHISSGASEVYINDVDMRVDVHKQGNFEHYQNVSTYSFEYISCPWCDDPMNCDHSYKEVKEGQFPVCNELLSQLLGSDKVRAGDDMAVIKERMVRCIANNSSINRDRFSNLSNVDLDRNTLRVALAIVSSRKLRDQKIGADCLPLNF